MKVTVTPEDIRHGIIRDVAHGPLALACARALGLVNDRGWVNVGVSAGILFWLPKGARKSGDQSFFDLWRHVELPDPVKAWELAFDRGEPVEPITFEVRIP
jgi:hypothetical protein